MAKNNSQSGIKERVALRVKTPRKYKVILLNDDFTPMDFVVMVLTQIFRKSEAEATAIMLEVHHKGQGVAGFYTLDEALTRSNRAMQWARDEGFPLRVKCEPE